MLADLNDDHAVDDADWALFDENGTTREEGDLDGDGDGDVDDADEEMFWTRYGTQPEADGPVLMLA